MCKFCKYCKTTKSMDAFAKAGMKNGKQMYRSRCKECESKAKRVLMENRKIPTKNVTDDPVYKKCLKLANNAHARIFADSKAGKKCYRDKSFAFNGSGELKWYLYNNFYSEIQTLLRNGDVPSIDRIDTSKGYETGNIRIISFKRNTELGVAKLRKRVLMKNPSTGEEVIFSSVSDCTTALGYPRTHTGKVSSWCKRDGKYKLPNDLEFSYVL